MGEMLWRLSRPVIGLAVASAVCLLLALLIVRGAGVAGGGAVGAFASVLSGIALICMLLAVIEFLLAAVAYGRWSAGGGRRCPGCDWPMSPSMLLPDRCVNPAHSDQTQGSS